MEDSLSFRKSTKEDEAILRELFMEGFGERDDILTQLPGRYLMAFSDGELAGVVGLNYQPKYRGKEIDYCTVRKKYRGRGIMMKLFAEILKDAPERVYCCAWRIRENDRANLQGVLEAYGFQKVLDQMSAYRSGYNCHVTDLKGCAYYVPGGACRCFEDLWVWEKEK